MTGITTTGSTVNPKKTITVLTDPANIQVKTITPTEVIAAKQGEWFHHADLPFETLEDLYRIIAGLQNNQLMIHAERTETPELNGMVRATCHVHRKTNTQPFYRDRPAHTLTIDLDDTLVPPNCSWERPTEMAGAVWRKLQADNPQLQGVGCVWKTSGSAAAPGREKWAKFHFTVILGNALLWHDRRTALEAITGADTAMSRIVQKHYLAGRVCVGLDDPLAHVETSGIIPGDALWQPTTPQPTANPYEIDVQISETTTDFGRDKLRTVCAAITNAPPGTRHDTVLRLSYLIGGYVGGGEISENDAYTFLRNAVTGYKNPKHHWVTIADAVPAGIDFPRSNVADWATEILATDFDPRMLAEYAMTLEEDQRDLLLDLLDRHSTAKQRKAYEKAYDAATAAEAVERGVETVRALLGMGGQLERFVLVEDNGEKSSKAIAFEKYTHSRFARRDFCDALAYLGTIPQLNAKGTISHTPVTDYWWTADETPKVKCLDYDPNQSLFMTNLKGYPALNTYLRPHPMPAQRGQDVTPFQFLMNANFPDGNDAELLTKTLAFVVQHPGELLRYAPVVQGTQGCGKGMLITWTLEHCCGMENIGLPDPENLTDKFNAYHHQKTVVICDEIGERRWAELNEIIEAVKKPITERFLSVRKMRTDLFTARNFAKFFFMTNHIDSMLGNDPRERRFMHLCSAMQEPDDIPKCLPVSAWDAYPQIAAQLPPDATFFDGYAIWWDNGGAEAVRGYLGGDVVAAHAGRAPQTSVTVTVRQAAKSELETDLDDAIAHRDLGFAGGFVSSMAIRHMLEAHDKKPISTHVMKKLLDERGYRSSWAVNMTPTEMSWFPTQGRGVRRPRFTIYSTYNHFTTAKDAYEAYIAAQDKDKAAMAGGFTMGDDTPPMVN